MSLVSGPANVIYPPFNTAVTPGLDEECVLYDAHRLQSSLEHVGYGKVERSCVFWTLNTRTVSGYVFLRSYSGNFIEVAGEWST